MAVSVRFRLTDKAIKKSLDALSVQSDEIASALTAVGYPSSRRREHSFESLARIVVGQQLSTKAAATISHRTVNALGGEWRPEAVLSAASETLRAAGLSQQKAGYLQSLADAVLSGSLSLDVLAQQSDQEVEAAITAIRGFGRWSAHMYMMFALGRPDIWPSGDLAVRVGFGRIMGWPDRPTERTVIIEGAAFAPHRSALALLCWHYYTEARL
ncbi:MAG: DNA repair protein [Halieaceae bacterium]|nr:DNA repair protein [Halieaceae bacterium]